MNGDDTKNMILAIALCLGILFAFQYFFPTTPAETAQKTTTTTATKQNRPVDLPDQPTKSAEKIKPRTVAKRIQIKTNKLSGSVSTLGARIDDLILTQYKETDDPDAKPVRLLSPSHSEQPYYAESGWTSIESEKDDLPTAESEWWTEDTLLTPEAPITLRYINKNKVIFEKTISVDENYVFTIVDRVRNPKESSALNLYNYGLLIRAGTPPVSSFFISYEGPLGYLDGKKHQNDYEDLIKEKKISYTTQSGWLGYSDKYWLGALIPDQNVEIKTNMIGSDKKDQKRYQLDYVMPLQTIMPGETHETTSHFYAGPKRLDLLDAYEKTLNIPHFDLAVDFGWFYFITKPIFYILIFFHNYVGNYGLAIILLTIAMNILFFPLARSSYRSMAKMKALQPEIQKLKELYPDDKMKQQQEMMALFKKHKTNPASGCLPQLIKAPVFFALYKVIFISIEMRHAPFFGWIHDLSAADPTNIFTLFGLISWNPPSFMHFGLLPILMGGTMFLQQRLNPQPMDDNQKMIFTLMPIMFTFFMAGFPAGVLLYWTCSNILGMAQQSYFLQTAPKGVPKPVKKSNKKSKA
ncbi:MAG: membrane protein insertase YidC [Rickettsiales bacterium]|nr:membrane protein insertase YidC [Rickettsiales bacterium]|tara:strand:+ start:16724 stop:18460 length:1737 start_codon:yes stop_codon:yes gene_type:complete